MNKIMFQKKLETIEMYFPLRIMHNTLNGKLVEEHKFIFFFNADYKIVTFLSQQSKKQHLFNFSTLQRYKNKHFTCPEDDVSAFVAEYQRLVKLISAGSDAPLSNKQAEEMLL